MFAQLSVNLSHSWTNFVSFQPPSESYKTLKFSAKSISVVVHRDDLSSTKTFGSIHMKNSTDTGVKIPLCTYVHLLYVCMCNGDVSSSVSDRVSLRDDSIKIQQHSRVDTVQFICKISLYNSSDKFASRLRVETFNFWMTYSCTPFFTRSSHRVILILKNERLKSHVCFKSLVHGGEEKFHGMGRGWKWKSGAKKKKEKRQIESVAPVELYRVIDRRSRRTGVRMGSPSCSAGHFDWLPLMFRWAKGCLAGSGQQFDGQNYRHQPHCNASSTKTKFRVTL